MTRASQSGADQGAAYVRGGDRLPSQSTISSPKRSIVLNRLRERIRQIENTTLKFSVADHHSNKDQLAAHSPSGLPVEDGGALPRFARTLALPSSFSHQDIAPAVDRQAANIWSLGGDAASGNSILGDIIGGRGLEADGVHEIKPCLAMEGSSQKTLNWAAAWSAARTFMIGLLIRRLRCLIDDQSSQAPVFWCWPRHFAQEFGGLYGPGLNAIGLSPGVLTIVEPSRAQDVLWAMEECLRLSRTACVVGMVDDISLTPARRLALTAKKYAVPAVILTGPRAANMAATSTRWRVGPSPSTAHPIDETLPGHPCLQISLERRRCHPLAAALNFNVEWNVRQQEFIVPQKRFGEASFSNGFGGVEAVVQYGS